MQRYHKGESAFGCPRSRREERTHLGQTKVSVKCHSRRRKSVAFLFLTWEVYTLSSLPLRSGRPFPNWTVSAGRQEFLCENPTLYLDMTEA